MKILFLFLISLYFSGCSNYRLSRKACTSNQLAKIEFAKRDAFVGRIKNKEREIITKANKLKRKLNIYEKALLDKKLSYLRGSTQSLVNSINISFNKLQKDHCSALKRNDYDFLNERGVKYYHRLLDIEIYINELERNYVREYVLEKVTDTRAIYHMEPGLSPLEKATIDSKSMINENIETLFQKLDNAISGKY